MLYKFKSKADGDLIMHEANGRQILEIIGKTPGSHGIIQVSEFAAAEAALNAAFIKDNQERKEATGEAKAHMADSVSLQQRAMPFITMLHRCAKEDADVTW